MVTSVARALVVLIALSATAHAQDEFEIQVYDSGTARQGDVGVELHMNHHLIAGASNQTHTTFEPHYGVTEWLEVGGYLQSSTSRGDAIDFAGVKLRAKARMTHRLWHDRIGLAINAELSAIPSKFEEQTWGSEVRPIADLQVGWLYASVNPILAVDLAGGLAGHPELEPCAKLEALVAHGIGIGVEGYGGFGPLDDLGSASAERGYVVFDYAGRVFDVNFGVGLTHGSSDHPVAKLIFGMHP